MGFAQNSQDKMGVIREMRDNYIQSAAGTKGFLQSITQSITSTIADGQLEETKYILNLARQSGWDPKSGVDDYLAIDYAISVKQAMLDGDDNLLPKKHFPVLSQFFTCKKVI